MGAKGAGAPVGAISGSACGGLGRSTYLGDGEHVAGAD